MSDYDSEDRSLVQRLSACQHWWKRSRPCLGQTRAGGTGFISLLKTSPPRSSLRAAGVPFRNDIVTEPGGSQILLEDPALQGGWLAHCCTSG